MKCVLARLIFVVLAAAGLPLLWIGAASAHTYSYETQTRGDVESDFQQFREIARETFDHIRGWSLNLNVEFTEVSSGEDFDLILASPEEVDRAAPGCSERWSCRVGDEVLINDRRWRETTPSWPLSRREYRHYVTNHEVGHWLGLGHADCPGEGRDAPVMMQQSKGLQGCNARVWPKFWERRRVADDHDVDGWPTPPQDAPCTITGSSRGERLEGNHHADVVCGQGGNDELIGKKGFDVLRGGSGDDFIGAGAQADFVDGGDGEDTIIGWAGPDELRGKKGHDLIRGKTGDDFLGGGGGRDELYSGAGDDVVKGWADDDILIGWGGDDLLVGLGGDDELRGKFGGDRLEGGIGNDFLGGGSGDDELVGDEGNDTLRGWAGDDVLLGNRGADVLEGRAENDDIYGGKNDDTLRGHEGNDLLNGQKGTDTCEPGPGRDDMKKCEN